MQVLIVGLGQFGTSLARALADRKIEVLAADASADRVQAASAFVTDALCFDAMDQKALAAVSPEKRDVCVCAMGPEAREASIVVTALLRQMGAPRVVARAADEIHERILRLVGAHEVVNPDRAFGEQFASHLLLRSVIAQVPLGDDLMLTELAAPSPVVGRTLKELALPTRHGITVVALRRGDPQGRRTMLPDPTSPIAADDVLVVVSPAEAVERWMKGLGR
ncbi:MAG: TrkA family potassium uptake protein [Proteobacteria bacterium]|jgi:trk system potassium uptake protein TrkA|nr:TrkA family potassium uptake protein [Pseudomonadota bacterium]